VVSLPFLEEDFFSWNFLLDKEVSEMSLKFRREAEGLPLRDEDPETTERLELLRLIMNN